MAFQIKFTAYSSHSAKKLNPDAKKTTRMALKELSENPFIGKELQAELSGFWTYNFLRYRIIFKINTQGKIVVVWGIGHRRDIYESFSEYFLRERK